MHPHVTDPTTIELIWNKPDEEGLKRFLVDEKGFAETRVENGLKKIKVKTVLYNTIEQGFKRSLT